MVTGHIGTEHLYAMEEQPADLRTLGAMTVLGFRLIVLVAFLTSGKKVTACLVSEGTYLNCLLLRREGSAFQSDKIDPQNSVWNLSVLNIYWVFSMYIICKL